MSTSVIEEKPAAAVAAGISKDTYKGKIHPDWCPGCGDFSVLAAIQTALGELQLEPYNVCVVSGIGCSSNLPGYVNSYGMHTLHGRGVAVAGGVKMANHELTVISTGGDGDGFGIGVGHFIHAMRRNIDITYIVMDNQIYGLTTGQTSPTSPLDLKTKTAPKGNVENPINPIPLAIAGGATYVARGYSAKQRHLADIIKAAIQHKGFSFIDVFSPCVTWNKQYEYKFFNPRIKILEDEGHDPKNFEKAIERGYQFGEEIPIGLFWKRDDLPCLDALDPVCKDGPVALRKLGLTAEQKKLVLDDTL